MKTRLIAILATLVALTTLGLQPSRSAATCTILSIPNPVTANYTAPAGSYCPGSTATVKTAGVTVDLSQANITGTGTGYLLKTFDGANFTIKTGNVSAIAGIVTGQLGVGQRVAVTIDGGAWTNVVSGFLYKVNDGGRADVTLKGVHATGLGAGIRTYGSAYLLGNNLVGGGNPSSGEPAAVRALDLNDIGTVVPGQVLVATNNTIAGFLGGNSDGINGEETVDQARVEDNVLSDFGDAGVDLKVASAFVVGNTFTGTFGGNRLMAVHTGRTYSGYNSFAVPTGAAGIQATGTVVSDRDTFTLTGTGLIAKATVACTGSTGFSGPRAGDVTLHSPVWTPAGGTPWVAIPTTCSGTVYTPHVTVD